MERKIMSLKIEDIKQIENARITYKKEEMSELMAALKGQGLLSPIGVRPIKNGKWEVVYGNRRLMAAKKLGWANIDAMEVEADTNEDMMVLNAVENMQRQDVPFAEQGRIFHSLTKSGLTVAEIAARIGLKEYRVRKILDTYRAVPESQRPNVMHGVGGMRIKGGRLPSSTANLVISLSSRMSLPKAEVRKLIDFGAKDGITSAHMKNLVGLVKQGHTPEKAMKLVEETRVVTISVALKKKHIQDLEKKYRMTIHEIIYEALKAEDWLGIITASGSKSRHDNSQEKRSN